MKNPFKKEEKIVVVKKTAPKEEKLLDICPNCENSGRECNTCGGGKDVV